MRLTHLFHDTVRFANKIRPTVVMWALTVTALAPIAWLAMRHFYWTDYATARRWISRL